MYEGVADKMGVQHMYGPEDDVLGRLAEGLRCSQGSHALCKTPEDPYLHYEDIERLWDFHCRNLCDLTYLTGTAEGLGFDIVSREALLVADNLAGQEYREHPFSFFFANSKDFKVLALEPLEASSPSHRVTGDNPEDLILLREIYRELKRPGVPIRANEISSFLSMRPDLTRLVEHLH